MNKIFSKVLIRFLPNKYKYYLKEDYITAHADVKWWEHHINNTVLQQYSSLLVGKVADFGCNHGACTILAARNEKLNEIIGFDMNGEAIKQAEKLLSECMENEVVKQKVKFKKTSLQKINMPSDYFDSAFMFHVIEHIYPKDRKTIFSDIRRVVKRNGVFIITTPYQHAYDTELQHVDFFDENTLSEVIAGLGFEVIECYRDQRKDSHTPQGHDCLNIICKNNK